MIKKVYYIGNNYDDETSTFPVFNLKEAWNIVKDCKDYYITGFRWEYHEDTNKCNRKSLETYLNEQENCYVVKITNYDITDGTIIKTKYKSFNNLREAVMYKLSQYVGGVYCNIQKIENDELVPLDTLEETAIDRIITNHYSVANNLPF